MPCYGARRKHRFGYSAKNKSPRRTAAVINQVAGNPVMVNPQTSKGADRRKVYGVPEKSQAKTRLLTQIHALDAAELSRYKNR